VKTTVERILLAHSSAVERFDVYGAEPASVEISFDHGVPLAINDVNMALAELIGCLATIAGAHGVTSPDALLHAAGQALQKRVVASGTVELEVFHTGWRVVSCQSPHALDPTRAEQLAAGNS
jgi:arginosuccinate synthase-like protein